MTQNDLKQLISYDPVNGIFTWLKRPYSRPEGTVAGSINLGYVRITVNHKSYFAHRLAWLWMTGEWPVKMIDHIDGNKSNNSWSNLREASNSENQMNSKKSKSNKSGIKGICKSVSKWMAYISVNKKQKYLGTYDTIQEAAIVRQCAEKEVYNLFAYKENNND
jgi:hypothetical protein